jgi:hypothetical protein
LELLPHAAKANVSAAAAANRIKYFAVVAWLISVSPHCHVCAFGARYDTNVGKTTARWWAIPIGNPAIWHLVEPQTGSFASPPFGGFALSMRRI